MSDEHPESGVLQGHDPVGWTLVKSSVIGSSHVRNGKPNQDSARSLGERDQLPVFLAVADGHGSARSFLSDVGSSLATVTALDVLLEFYERELRNLEDTKNLSEAIRSLEGTLPRTIINRWRTAVDPVSKGVLFNYYFSKLPRTQADERREPTELERYMAFGSTLLAAMISEEVLVFLQLGDGDIFAVDHLGNVEFPIPQEETLGEDTFSLCLQKPEQFKVRVVRLNELPKQEWPVLICLSTDGLRKSFEDEGFIQFAKDVVAFAKEHGSSGVQAKISEWFAQYSRNGSGDDVSAIMVFNEVALSAMPFPIAPSEAVADDTQSTHEQPVDDLVGVDETPSSSLGTQSSASTPPSQGATTDLEPDASHSVGHEESESIGDQVLVADQIPNDSQHEGPLHMLGRLISPMQRKKN